VRTGASRRRVPRAAAPLAPAQSIQMQI